MPTTKEMERATPEEATSCDTVGQSDHPEAVISSAGATVVTPSKVPKHKNEPSAEQDVHPTVIQPDNVASMPNDADDEEEEEEVVSGDTVLGFSRFPELCNREILLNHYGFCMWAQRQPNPGGPLKVLLDWMDTDEAKALKLEVRGNEKFTYGQHSGKTFREIAEQDPKYHTRYVYMLKRKNQQPNDFLARYIEYFNDYSRAKRRVKREATMIQQTPPKRVCREQPTISGNEKFHFGQHKGETFWEIAQEDPSYHLRFKAMNDSPNATLDRYIEWFNTYGPGPSIATQAQHDYLGGLIGIEPYSYDEEY